MMVVWLFIYFLIFSAGIVLRPANPSFRLVSACNRENFASYIAANNRAAIFPAILAAFTLTILSVVLLFRRPAFFSFAEAAVCVTLNVVNLASTMVWQGRMHERLAHTGYDDRLVKRLIQTNWVRTVGLLPQSLVVFAALTRIECLVCLVDCRREFVGA